jgi:hypothetical protein
VKVLVDTSVWISYFNEHENAATTKLASLIDSGQEILTSPLIIQAILQGLPPRKGPIT